MRTCLRLVFALGSLALSMGCSSSSPSSSPAAASGSAALSPNAGGCAPSVNVSTSSCSVTVNGTTCDCTDCNCIASAVESCVGLGLDDAGIPAPAGGNIPGLDDAGLGSFDDGGLPLSWPDSGVSLPWADDAGSSSSSCGSSAIAAAKAQFCSDVDSWLAAHGSTASLDCSQVGATSFPVGAPPNLGQGPAALVCGAATQAAFSKVESTLASCNPCSYLGWDTSAQLQLFENGVCEP